MASDLRMEGHLRYGRAMISAMVRVSHGTAALGATLAALVPAVTEGVIGDAVLLVQRPDGDAARIADAVGASMVVYDAGDPWRRGADTARHDWILCLDDGDVPSAGWVTAVERFVVLGGPERRFGRLRRRPRTLGSALLEIGQTVARRHRVGAGDLVHRSLLLGSARPKHRPVWVAALVERDPGIGSSIVRRSGSGSP